MEKLFYYNYDTKIGNILIVTESDFIIKIGLNADFDRGECKRTELSDKAATQLLEYFDGKRKNFDLPIKFSGTTFMQRVYEALLKIPYGKTASYKDIAEKIGNPRAVRAVGLANNKNPLPFIVPCHRVIGSNKKLVGYAFGLPLKEELLTLERGNVS